MTLRDHCEEIMQLIDEVLGSDGHDGDPAPVTPALLRVEECGRPRATGSAEER